MDGQDYDHYICEECGNEFVVPFGTSDVCCSKCGEKIDQPYQRLSKEEAKEDGLI